MFYIGNNTNTLCATQIFCAWDIRDKHFPLCIFFFFLNKWSSTRWYKKKRCPKVWSKQDIWRGIIIKHQLFGSTYDALKYRQLTSFFLFSHILLKQSRIDPLKRWQMCFDMQEGYISKKWLTHGTLSSLSWNMLCVPRIDMLKSRFVRLFRIFVHVYVCMYASVLEFYAASEQLCVCVCAAAAVSTGWCMSALTRLWLQYITGSRQPTADTAKPFHCQ